MSILVTGCAHFDNMVPRWNDPRKASPQRSMSDTELGKWALDQRENNKDQWSEWDEKYVSDDVLVVEIVDFQAPKKGQKSGK